MARINIGSPLLYSELRAALNSMFTELYANTQGKYTGTVNLLAETTVQKITTCDTIPYSILLIDADDNIITHNCTNFN